MNPKIEEASTGCVRGTLYEKGQGGFDNRLDLVLLNDVALRRLAATYGEGQGKYGTFNWQKGFPESVYLCHAMEHLLKYMSGESTEDDLAHAIWNLMTLMWIQEKKPELLDIQNARGEIATLQKSHVFDGVIVGGVVSSECKVCKKEPSDPIHIAAWQYHPFKGAGDKADKDWPCEICGTFYTDPIHSEPSA